MEDEIEHDNHISPLFGRVHIAVSKTNQPQDCGRGADGWFVDVVDLHAPTQVTESFIGIPDHPIISADADNLYIAAPDVGCPYVQPPGLCQDRWGVPLVPFELTMTGLTVVPKAPLLNNIPAVRPVFVEHLGHGTSADTPASMYGPTGSPQLLLATDRSPWVAATTPETALRVTAVVPQAGGGFSTPTIPVPLPTGAVFWRTDGEPSHPLPQYPTIQLTRSVFQHAVHRDGFLYGAMHVLPNINGAPGPYHIVRWFKIAVNNWPASPTPGPQVVEWHDINLMPYTLETYDPSLAVTSRGEVSVTFTASGPYTWPQYWRALYPLGGGVDLRVMRISYCIHEADHIADYSSDEPDPYDYCVSWGHSLLAHDECTNVWQSWLGRYYFCPPTDDMDLFEDGVYDAFDGLVCDARFQALDGRADFVRDGVIDAQDYIAFHTTLRVRLGQRRR